MKPTDMMFSVNSTPDATEPARDEFGLLGHDLRAAMSDIIGGLQLIDESQMDSATRAQIDRVMASSELLARLLEEGLTLITGECGQAQPHLTDIPCITHHDKKHLHFVVADEGPGLTRTALEILFQPQPGTRRQDRPGNGMGLHIAKELSTGIGAHLDVFNRPELGTEGRLILPYVATSDASQTGRTRQNIKTGLPDLRGYRVLLADDNSVQQTVIGKMLEDIGADVLRAEDGAEALTLMSDQPCDAALIDVEMPGLSGSEAIRTLRKGSTGHALPVIAVTTHGSQAKHQSIKAAGAGIVLLKPIIDPGPLDRAIRYLIDASATGANHARTSPAIAQPSTSMIEPPMQEMDTAAFDRLLEMAGPEIAQDLVSRFIQDLSSVEGRLRQGLLTPDWPALSDASHVLIALAGTAGADCLLADAREFNAHANDQNLPAIQDISPALMQRLDALLQFLKSLPDHIGMGT